MRQAAVFVAILALLDIPWAGSACAAGSPSELLNLSYGIAYSAPPAWRRCADGPSPGNSLAAREGCAEGAGRSSSLPARLEELLLKPEVAIPAPVAVAIPPAQPMAYENLWDRIRGGFAMPHLESALVDRWQASYLARPQVLKGILERSRRYLFHVVEEASRREMPLELALLPMVESGYNPVALSSAQASGLWQFIPSTARDYKLHLTPDYDARRDIVASTSAALDYLQTLHDRFGDWHLALAAYNWGEKSVAKAIDQNAAKGLRTDFASLALPEETRNYVPKLQALKNLVAYAETFKLELDPIPNQPYFTTIANDRSIDFAVAARLSGVSLQELNSLNPGHNGPTVSKNSASGLVLPVEHADTFLSNFETYKNTPPPKPARRRKP
jgi:membrane-bound lytic murein transglycosylase D